MSESYWQDKVACLLASLKRSCLLARYEGTVYYCSVYHNEYDRLMLERRLDQIGPSLGKARRARRRSSHA